MTGPRPSSEQSGTARLSLAVEAAVFLGLFLLYLGSFELKSPVNGPYEVFAQDSVYILKYLERGKPFRWNPQSHLLYHWVVDRGFLAWKSLFGPGIDSVYHYLKLFTALCGVGFLLGMRWLFCELRLRWQLRVALLLVTGVSVMAWFHFAAFETHSLAMPALAVYLVALARLRNRETRTARDRLLLVGSLLVCGWTRVDLFRFAVATLPLLALPRLRRHFRGLAVDLALVAALGLAGSAWLAHSYFGTPLPQALTAAFHRADRRELHGLLGTVRNLEPRPLLRVGRAVTLYSLAMPVAAAAPGRSFFAPPTFKLELEYPGEGVLPSTTLFLEPATNMLGSALSLAALAAVSAALLWAMAFALYRALAGDVFQAGLLVQALCGWLLYAWFNPLEPFLWSLEFMPLWIAMLADPARERGRGALVAFGLLAACLALHNWFAFYVPFR